MVKSLLLALFVFALCVLCAWAVRHFGRKAGEPEGKIRALVWMFLVGGAVASVFAFRVDFSQRQTTLYEELLEGSMGVEVGTDAPVRTAAFDVEHPGVEHTLYVQPKPAFAQEAAGPVELGILVADEAGRRLIEEARWFETERVGGDSGDFSEPRLIWEAHSWRFTPERPGPHRLELGLVHVGIHEVFVRIEDPEKRDGKRAAGY